MGRTKKYIADIVDKRPEVLKGKEIKTVSGNLATVQGLRGYTNEQMANLMGVSTNHYDRLKAGKNSLSLEKLQILYYSLGVDLNRFVGDDVKYGYIRTEYAEDMIIDNKMLGKMNVNDLMAEISHISALSERKARIMEIYNALGKLLINTLD